MGKAESESNLTAVSSRTSSAQKLKLEDFPLRKEHVYHTSAKWFEAASVILEIDENDLTWSEDESLTSASKIKTAAEVKIGLDQQTFVDQMIYFDIHNQAKIQVDQVELPPLMEQEDDADYIACDFKDNNHDIDWIIEIEMQGEQIVKTKDVFPNKKTTRSPEMTAAFLSVIRKSPELKGRDPYQEFLDRFSPADQEKIEQTLAEAADHGLLDDIEILPDGDLTYKLNPIGMVRRERKIYLEPNQDLKDLKNLQKKTTIDSFELS